MRVRIDAELKGRIAARTERARQAGSRAAADLARRLATAALGLSVERGKVLVPDAQVESTPSAEVVARAAIQIARPLGEDPATDPIIDARLADGSCVAVCSPPAVPTTAITIRRFGGRAFTTDEQTASGSLSSPWVEAAAAVLRSERNVLISGGTGSGKTTLLNALVSLLPAGGRVISIENTLEVWLRRTNGPRFEARGLVGRDVTIRDLVRHALRHRPDHLVVGERGARRRGGRPAPGTEHVEKFGTTSAKDAQPRRPTCSRH